MVSKSNLMNWGKLFLVTLFIFLSTLHFIRIDCVSHSASDTLRPFFIQTAILMILFLPIYFWFTNNKASIKK